VTVAQPAHESLGRGYRATLVDGEELFRSWRHGD
jgi:hypothetical protein